MATADTGSSKVKNRRWTHEEDAMLVSCMVDLHNMGTKKSDTGFKAGYLSELEKMLATKLPNSNIKGKPHIESRIKTLKKEWSIVHDLFTNHNSGFGWDDERKMVTAEDDVWEAYLSSHKEAAQYRRKTFPFYNEFTDIYGKDRATGKDSQTGADIVYEMGNAEAVEGIGGTMEGSQDDNPVELQDNDFSFVPTQSSGAREMSSTKRKRKRSDTCEPITADSLLGAAMMLSEKLESVGDKISKSLGTELTLQQKIEQLEGKLSEIEGLEYDDKFMALIKLPEYPNQMLVFFSLAADQRLEWVKRFLATY
ncbi:uncharacterized protein At2g29880-like [Ipomoea triloba]|uniref:uncharacterized protein At2g29880-like n=1 Tax=Ipomoea triloba TaxID=35885 RepID=UPI00125DF28A|nr:uncharacterized protein At2g29880-like [Ipomoea triloba]